MSTIMADTYILEMKAWQNIISFYNYQLDTLKHKLYQAIKSPELIRDGARLETFQVHIIAFQDGFFEIEEAIQKQLTQIDTRYLFDDMFKNEAIEHEQVLLRYKMYYAEKKYLNFRHAISQYLISIFEVVILTKFTNHLPDLRSIGHRFTNIAF